MGMRGIGKTTAIKFQELGSDLAGLELAVDKAKDKLFLHYRILTKAPEPSAPDASENEGTKRVVTVETDL